MHQLLSRQLRRYFGDDTSLSPQWNKFLEAVGDVYHDFDTRRELLERSLVLSSQELHQTNAEMRAVFQAIPDLLFRLNRDGTILDLKAGTMADLVHPPRDLIGKRFQNIPDKQIGDKFRDALRQMKADNSMASIEYSLDLNERKCFYEARLVPLLADQIVVIVRNITNRKRTESKLAESNKQLLEISRNAGMADVATGVLHNIGNVLNSVNVSAHLVYNTISTSRISTFFKAADLVRQNASNLAVFLTADERGKNFPAFLASLAETLAAERDSLLKELNRLAFNIDHICEIIAAQQSLAKGAYIQTTVSLGELIDDSLKINEASLQNRQITVIRDFDPAISITTDCHKVMQILINLISNAKDAVAEAECKTKEIAIRADLPEPDTLRISVVDTGVGINPQNMSRIFSFGFTTKKTGHGFGLHSSAIVANELGGKLEAHSDGQGKGAAFILTLPIARSRREINRDVNPTFAATDVVYPINESSGTA